MLPSEWQAENEDDIIRIVDQDEVGEIEITTLHKQSGKVMPGEIQTLAREESPEVPKWEAATAGAFSGVSGRYTEDGAAVREWYLGSDSLLLYVTYVCDEDDTGLDDASVDELLGTLVVGDSQKA
jgi:hypothetical protein